MRIRKQLVSSLSSRTDVYNGNTLIGTNKSLVNVSTIEKLELSSGHPFFSRVNRPLPKRPKRYRGKDPEKVKAFYKRLEKWSKKYYSIRFAKQADLGGSFSVSKILPAPAAHDFHDSPSGPFVGVNSRFKGTLAASVDSTSLVRTLFPSSDLTLAGLGTIGISRALPTSPIANTGQFIGELRDLPRIFNPFLWEGKAKRFKQLARNGSNEYLNVEFGWSPFIADILQFFDVTSSAQKTLEQYSRDSGKHIRRRRNISSSLVTDTFTYSGNFVPYPPPQITVTGGQLTRTTSIQTRSWFSGAFTYYLPPIDGSVSSYYNRYSAYAQKLYGIKPLDPFLVWELTPWSWALDWISNSRSVLRNLSAFSTGDLVMHYGYVMEEKIKTQSWALTGYKFPHASSPTLWDTRTEISRVRLKATPFGFGLNPASFSPFQKGIIAALGINRASKWL
jgi:hypothetical protein